MQTPNPLTAETLTGRFHAIIMRTIRNFQVALEGVPVQDVQFQFRR